MTKHKNYEIERSAKNKETAKAAKEAVFDAEDNDTIDELISMSDIREVGYFQVMSRLNTKQHAQLVAIASNQGLKLMRGRGKMLQDDVTAQQIICQLIEEKYNQIKQK
ncbi:TPA: hypothetical protein ACVO3I_001148 [Vibrio diabolicus]